MHFLFKDRSFCKMCKLVDAVKRCHLVYMCWDVSEVPDDNVGCDDVEGRVGEAELPVTMVTELVGLVTSLVTPSLGLLGVLVALVTTATV